MLQKITEVRLTIGRLLMIGIHKYKSTNRRFIHSHFFIQFSFFLLFNIVDLSFHEKFGKCYHFSLHEGKTVANKYQDNLATNHLMFIKHVLHR